MVISRVHVSLVLVTNKRMGYVILSGLPEFRAVRRRTGEPIEIRNLLYSISSN